MLVHQCNSCLAISSSANKIPQGWRKVVIEGVSTYEFELCSQCVTMPMTFGNITVHRGVNITVNKGVAHNGV